jgi:PAS domain S-box-containing protein
MNVAARSKSEEERLAALASYQILDTPREAIYDTFTQVAAQMCGVRMAALTFVDASREWFKAATGVSLESIDRQNGFGDATIGSSDVLEVGDAQADPRFSACALVSGEPHVRFFAGVPLRTRQGLTIGTFCVMSRVPHVLTVQQRNGMRELAVTVMAALDARREMMSLFAQSTAAQAEIALLLSAIDVAGDAILVYEADRGTGALTLRYMNEAYARQTGYTREEAVGSPMERFRKSMPDDRGMTALRDAIKNGVPAKTEIVSYRKDGSSFWNQISLHPIRDATGKISHWISVERDVTQSVERESQLEDHYARLLMLTATARRLFGTLDTRALVVRVDEAARELLGAAATVHRVPEAPAKFEDELLARAAQTRGHASTGDRRRAAAAAGVGTISHVIEVRTRNARPLRDGDLFVLDLLAEYFGVAVRNASLVEELEERRSAILELNQVKTDLIAMLAHDFKSPLTSIVGFSELAMEFGPVNDDQRMYLETIKKIALRLADLATDTLAFSRLERNEIDLTLDEVEVGALVAEVTESLSDQRTVSVGISGESVVRGDSHRLRQVVSNLVENAVKYSPGGEPVEPKFAAAMQA